MSVNYDFLPESIRRLEERGLSLSEQLEILEDAAMRIRTVKGDTGERITNKLESILRNNTGLSELQYIDRVLRNVATDQETAFERLQKLQPDLLGNFKYAPICTCDVERSFSRYKNVLR